MIFMSYEYINGIEMVYPIVEPSVGNPLHQADGGRVLAALVLSLAVHAAVISWTPPVRPATVEPPMLTVELMPKIAPAPVVEPDPSPPAPAVQTEPQPAPEPIAEPPPQPKPVVEPPPEPRPEPKTSRAPQLKPKPIRKKPAPIKAPPAAPPPSETATPKAPPSTPQPIAVSPKPESSPKFSVPPEPPLPMPSELSKPQAQAIDSGLLEGYAQTLSGAIGRYQKYPRVARMRGWEGTVQVLLKIAASGAMRDISIAKSSGFDALDEQALDMVKHAAPLPKPPANLQSRDFSVEVPIVFRLKN